jgi:uncharacterized protein YrrD
MDLGAPGSYLTLEAGVPVYTSDGHELGKVAHVLAEEEADVFDGLVIDASAAPGAHRFVDAPDVDRIHERGVVLKIDSSEAERLREPSAGPATMETNPGDEPDSELESKLRRAWDLISGKW